MRITLRVFGYLSRQFGFDELRVELRDGSGLAELYRWIDDQYGKRLPDNLWDGALLRFRGPAVIAINGKQADGREKLREGDCIRIVAPLPGG